MPVRARGYWGDIDRAILPHCCDTYFSSLLSHSELTHGVEVQAVGGGSREGEERSRNVLEDSSLQVHDDGFRDMNMSGKLLVNALQCT
jgi:hypothetical protein